MNRKILLSIKETTIEGLYRQTTEINSSSSQVINYYKSKKNVNQTLALFYRS